MFGSRIRRVILVPAALLLAMAASAQQKESGKWSLDAKLEAAGSFAHSAIDDNDISRNEGLFDVTTKFQKPKFYIETRAKGELKSVVTEVIGLSYNLTEGKEKMLIDYTGNHKYSRDLKVSVAGGFLYNDWNEFTFKYSFGAIYDEPMNNTASVNLLSEPVMAQGSEETAYGYKCTNLLEGGWIHKFKAPDRILKVNASYGYDHDDRYDIWEIGKATVKEEEVKDEDYKIEKEYRLTPTYVDHAAKINSGFTAKDFCGVKRLDVEYRLNGTLKIDDDIYEAANLVGEEWQDSVRYRAHFNYVSLAVDPVARAKYSIKNFTVDGEITPEYFNYRLDDTEHHGRMDSPSMTFLAQLRNTWDITPEHQISFKVQRNIKRPDYLQMCWFQRPGNLKDELMAGNTSLLPSLENNFNYQYKFKHGRLSTTFEAGHLYKTRSIEKTFSNQVIEGHNFRVYTWINSGHSYKTNLKLTAAWNGNRFKADVMGNINFFRGFNAKEVMTKTSDWECKANASFDWTKGWETKASLRYQSKIIRTYSSMTEYLGLDVSLTKKFKKGWTIYVKGNDLLDKMIEYMTLSEDGNEGRVENRYLNRRIIRFGVNYKF